MMSAPIWRRLLWKECRESWPILLLGIVLPLLALLMSRNMQEHRDNILLPAIGVVILLVILWAADRVQSKGAGYTDNRFNLPLPAPMRWVTALLIPLPVAIITGAVIGYVSISLSSGDQSVQETTLAGVAYMVAIFLACSTLTSIYSAIPAMLISVLMAFILFDSSHLASSTHIFLDIIAIVLPVALVWYFLAKRRWLLAGRIGIGMGIIGIIFFLIFPSGIDNLNFSQNNQASNSNDGTFFLNYKLNELGWHIESNLVSNSSGSAVAVKLDFSDGRLPKRYSVTTSLGTRPMVRLDPTHVALFLQLPHASMAHILVWNVKTGEIHERAHARMAQNCAGGYAVASPDTRFVIVAMRSALGEGYDFWVIDLQQGRMTMVMPHVAVVPLFADIETMQASWRGNRAFISGLWDSDGLNINLTPPGASMLHIPTAGRKLP